VIKKITVLMFSLLFVQSAFSTNYFYDKDLPIPKGSKIKLIKFEKVADGIFKGYVVGFDGEGPFYTRAEHLAKSIKSLSFRVAHKKSKNLVGKTFKLSSELVTVVPPPIKIIKKK
jgi:hypothetical protein